MSTIYYTAASLDGFIATADNSLDWLFRLEGEGNQDYPEFIRDVGAVAMGSTTYEWILNYEKLLEDDGKRWPYEQPTWIFTTRKLPAVPGADIRFVRGDVRPVHDEMTREAAGKHIWL